MTLKPAFSIASIPIFAIRRCSIFIFLCRYQNFYHAIFLTKVHLVLKRVV